MENINYQRKPGGWKKHKDLKKYLNTIIYVNITVAQWNSVYPDKNGRLCSGKAAHRWHMKWSRNGFYRELIRSILDFYNRIYGLKLKVSAHTPTVECTFHGALGLFSDGGMRALWLNLQVFKWSLDSSMQFIPDALSYLKNQMWIYARQWKPRNQTVTEVSQESAQPQRSATEQKLFEVRNCEEITCRKCQKSLASFFDSQFCTFLGTWAPQGPRPARVSHQ